MFRQRTNQELARSLTLQDVQGIHTIKNQAKDCTIPRHLSLKILSITRLRFWSTETSRGKFSSEKEPIPQDMIQYAQKNPKGPFTCSNLPQRMHSPKIKIRVSQCKIHLIPKVKVWLFGQKCSSWPIIQENMVHCCIWTRFDQEIKITCKRSNLEKFKNFLSYGINWPST